MSLTARSVSIPRAVLLAVFAAGCGSSTNATGHDAGSIPDVERDDTDGGRDPVDVPPATDVGSDAGTTPDAGPHQAAPARVAYAQYDAAGHASLWVQRVDGSGRRQLHFSGIVDDAAEPDPVIPPPTDANVVGVQGLAWSPDGARLAAVVSVAHDQSEVVVLDVDAGGGAVVSYNGQYVMPALDWSADGTQLAYIMSTQPRAGGLELCVTNVATRRWRQVTNGAGLSGMAAQLRFVADGSAVIVSRVEDTGTAAPWTWHGRLLRVDLGTGAHPVLPGTFTGRIDAVRRDLSAVYAVRNRDDGGGTLVARGSGATGADTVLADDARFVAALPAPNDGALLLQDDVHSPGSDDSAWRYRLLRLPNDITRVDVPATVERIAVWVDD